MIDDLTVLINNAKIHKDLGMLEQIHNTILESLQYFTFYKKTHRKNETYTLKDEITQLESLNAKIFEVYADIKKNQEFRLKNKINYLRRDIKK